jgi:2-polyprenyl-3-methyl-5-hydroxy-6-metoxy-1,4-benzoquinol methylase
MQKNSLAELYRKHHERGSRYGYLYCHGARVPYLKEWIGHGKKVLDLGCRDGMLTEGYAGGNEVVGVDIDQKALELCRERLGIETEWLDLNDEWPWEEGSFDAIVACEIVEHLFVLYRFLERVAKTLKKGGTFIGSVPNAFRMRNRWKFLWGNEYETDPTHVRQFSYDRLQRVLGEYFTDVEIVPLEGSILPFIPVNASTPKAVSRLFAKDLLWRCTRTLP